MARSDWVKIIHVAKREVGLDDEAYRALLEGAAGVDSAAELTDSAQFNAVMRAFAVVGFKSVSPRNCVRWACSPRQRSKILALWYDVARRKNDMRSLEAFIKRTAGVDSPAFLTNHLASLIIVALEKMKTAKDTQMI